MSGIKRVKAYKADLIYLLRKFLAMNIQLTQSFQPHYGPGVDQASNRNEYQESSWG
jgi:hypothetical protein